MVPGSLDMLQSLDSRIRPYVKCLQAQSSRLSMTNDPLLITDPCSGYLPREASGANTCDRFKLKIPYAHQILTFIFDSVNLKEPPDFIFDQEDDDFCPPLEQISSLVCWDWQNSESLAAVVSDLLELYKEYQLKRAGTNLILQRHMRSLLAETTDGLQIIINKKERGLGTVNVLVKLEEKFSNLPPYLTQDNPGTDTAVLYVCFPFPESTSVQAQLFLSPQVEIAFGGSNSLHIPVFQQGILLGEYLSNIKQLLKQQVKLVCESFEKRKEYIAAFISHFGTSILEYDAQTFSKIVLLLEWNDFFLLSQSANMPFSERPFRVNINFVRHFESQIFRIFSKEVEMFTLFNFPMENMETTYIDHACQYQLHRDDHRVELPLYFPMDLPTFVFKSVYHNQNKKPYTERHNDFPYSPRWSGNEMAKRASAFILSTIKDFQKASVNNSDRNGHYSHLRTHQIKATIHV